MSLVCRPSALITRVSTDQWYNTGIDNSRRLTSRPSSTVQYTRDGLGQGFPPSPTQESQAAAMLASGYVAQDQFNVCILLNLLNVLLIYAFFLVAH